MLYLRFSVASAFVILPCLQVNEVASTGDVSPGEDENTKIADLAQKAQEAAQKIPSDARSAPAPQVADAAPTGISLYHDTIIMCSLVTLDESRLQ